MSKEEILDELKKVQQENIALHEKLSLMKKQKRKTECDKSTNQPVFVDATIPQRLAKIKAQLIKEEELKIQAKQEIQQLFCQQQDLQKQIDGVIADLTRNLRPQIKEQEEEMAKLFMKITEKAKQLPNADAQRVETLAQRVMVKRKDVFEQEIELERINHLIHINQPGVLPSCCEPNENSDMTPIPCVLNRPKNFSTIQRRVSYQVHS